MSEKVAAETSRGQTNCCDDSARLWQQHTAAQQHGRRGKKSEASLKIQQQVAATAEGVPARSEVLLLYLHGRGGSAVALLAATGGGGTC